MNQKDLALLIARRERGFTYIHMVVGVAGAAVIGSAIVGSAANFLKGNAGLDKSARTGQQMNAMAVAIKNALLDSDGDGTLEAQAYSSLGSKPADGGNLPQNLGLALSDPWGAYYGYCSWDNGTTNASANRNGGDNPGSQNSPLFAIISAGPDGAFNVNTTCANIKANNPATNYGDDLIRLVLQAAGTTGTSGALYFGEPVSNVASLNTAALRTGELRLETSSGNIKRWDGVAWQTVSGAAGASGGTWQSSVMNIADLPASPTGGNEGTVIWVTAENRPYIWTSVFGWRPVMDPPGTGTGNTPRQTLWAWGRNNNGQLGMGDTTDRSSPVQVGALTNWKQVVAGTYHTIAVNTDGTLWAWGLNNVGQLGLGDTTARSSPVQVGALTNWKQVAGSWIHHIAIKSDGTLWAWGKNVFGQLGLGDATTRSSPVQLGALSNWKQATAGYGHSAAIKTDGTLWAWGYNGFGALGLGDTITRSSPVQVGTLSTWKQVGNGMYHSHAIKTDGTLWAWGMNQFSGSLGLGDMIDRSSPVQVGALTDWKQMSSGGYSSAIKTDGTLWVWGANGLGYLGLGDTANRSSPVQVGGLSNWKQTSVSKFFTVATKTDGTLWAWGQNSYGGLGQGDTSTRSSPVQVGTRINWQQAAAGYWHSLAIQADNP